METLTIKQPKRDHMKKRIDCTGPNGTFTGFVEVLFNHRTENEERPIKGSPAKQKHFHIVRGNAEAITWVSNEFTNKDDAVFHAKKMEQAVAAQLHDFATQIEPKPEKIEQSLKNLGYV